MLKRVVAVLCFWSLALFGADEWKDQGILHLDHSPQAVMHPVPVRAVTLTDGFWSARRKTNVERSIPVMLRLLEEHGVVDNFRRLSGRKNVERAVLCIRIPTCTSGWRLWPSCCNPATIPNCARPLTGWWKKCWPRRNPADI